mmetsp:Transcript_27733/g.60254  ORF Transcript_27733/g.60254 Transcript_27733/m.60254 type:complete len:308 (+) Transcript_27733:679-1602(+)
MNAYSVGVVDVFSEGVAQQMKFKSKTHHRPILEAKCREEGLSLSDVHRIIHAEDVEVLELSWVDAAFLVFLVLEILLLLHLLFLNFLFDLLLHFLFQSAFRFGLCFLFAFRCIGGFLLVGLLLLRCRQGGALGVAGLLFLCLLGDQSLVAVGLGVPGQQGLLPVLPLRVEPLAGLNVLDARRGFELLLPLLQKLLRRGLVRPIEAYLVEAFVMFGDGELHERCIQSIRREIRNLGFPERPLHLFLRKLHCGRLLLYWLLFWDLFHNIFGARIRHHCFQNLLILRVLLFCLLLCQLKTGQNRVGPHLL